MKTKRLITIFLCTMMLVFSVPTLNLAKAETILQNDLVISGTYTKTYPTCTDCQIKTNVDLSRPGSGKKVVTTSASRSTASGFISTKIYVKAALQTYTDEDSNQTANCSSSVEMNWTASLYQVEHRTSNNANPSSGCSHVANGTR